MAVIKGRQEPKPKPDPALRKSSNELKTVDRVIHYDTDLLNCLRMSVDDKIIERGIQLTDSQQTIYDIIFT